MKYIIKNGTVFTCNPRQPWAKALSYENDKITVVADEIPESPGDNILDAGGRLILPGFIDSHTHPGMISQSSWHIKLPWFDRVEDLLDYVRDYAKAHPKEEVPFLYFEYYMTTLFDEAGPTKELLDTAVSDRPCLCQDFGEHLHWVNSKMLECMGIDKNSPDPVPGLEMFVRRPDGEPTGWIKELAWLRYTEKLFGAIGWYPPMVMTPELMKPFFDFCTDHGITAIGDGILEGEEQLQTLQAMEAAGDLNVYYDGIVRFWSLDDLPEAIQKVKRYQKQYGSPHIKLNMVKLFLDGTNESGNGALLEPLIGNADGKDYGEIKMDAGELAQCFDLCNREGMDLQIHMVGDRAFRVGCDAVEAAQAVAAREGRPWTTQPIFAHCELVDTADIPRARELGITINWSCHWAGGYFGTQAISLLGWERWCRMYRIREFIESGALVACSSDVTTLDELYRRSDPLLGIQISHTRIDPEFPLDEARFPGRVRPPIGQNLDLEDLVHGYTINSARQMRWEDRMGSLEPGKQANLVILSDNLFAVAPDRIKDIQTEAVLFDGKWVKEPFS